MSRVTPAWLALREGFDARARDGDLADALAAALTPAPLRVLDLGAGTGANFRYLAPRLGGDQHWTFVDVDGDLLDAAQGALRAWTAARGWPLGGEHGDLVVDAPAGRWTVARRRLDLARNLAQAEVGAADLVTASALMDLVSAPWFDDLAAACAGAARRLYVALSYDGRRAWTPAHPDDDAIRGWFNRHQGGDAGFGPALGPAAVAHMARTLGRLGFAVATARADWCVGAAQAAMHAEMITGAARACRQLAPEEARRIDAWEKARLGLARRHAARLAVGHVDLLALGAAPLA